MDELSLHLDLHPFLDLGIQIDAEVCLKEVSPLLPQFKAHRPDMTAGNGQWKTLGLKTLDGDSRQTDHYGAYGRIFVQARDFHWTDFAQKAPQTVEQLKKHFKTEGCHRIRWMLLEPNTEITVHSDAPEETVCLAYNLALNNPEGCEFWIDLNEDGSLSPFSKLIPFEPGKAFLINIAKYHKVINRSNEPRIHMIVHGEPALSNQDLLQRARIQNGISHYGLLLDRLIEKHTAVRKKVDSRLFQMWKKQGWTAEFWPTDVALCYIWDQTNVVSREDLEQISMSTPLLPCLHLSTPPIPIIEVSELQSHLQSLLRAGKKHVVVLGLGTFFLDRYVAAIEILKELQILKEQNLGMKGHLLQKEGRLPELHPQTFMLSLDHWQNAGKPDFTDRSFVQFPPYERSKENVHDNYTPLHLKPAEGAPTSGPLGFGTHVLAALLDSGFSLGNISFALRAQKIYAYPELSHHENRVKIKRQLDARRIEYQKIVFPFNTEPFETLNIPNYKPDMVITVAGGLKYAYLAKLFSQEKTPKLVVVDQSAEALKFVKLLSQVRSLNEVLQVLLHYLNGGQWKNPTWAETWSKWPAWMRRVFPQQVGSTYAKSDLEKTKERLIQEITGPFASEHDFIHALQLFKSASFVHANVIENSQFISAIGSGQKIFFWYSNLWTTDEAMAQYGFINLRERYEDFLRALAWPDKLQVWRAHGKDFAVLGEEFHEPRHVLAGLGPCSADESSFGRSDSFNVKRSIGFTEPHLNV